MRAAEPVRFAVEVDVLARRRLSRMDVDDLVGRAGVDAYRLPATRSGKPRYRLVGALPALRHALLDWSSDERIDHAWAMEKLAEAAPVPSLGDGVADWVERGGMTAHGVNGALTCLEGGLLDNVSEVPLWVRYAGQLHEVRRVVEEHVGAEGSPPGAAVPYRARQRVVVLDLDPPHALDEVALAVPDVTP